MLERLDLTLAMDRAEYNQQLKALQAELHELAFQVYTQKRPVVIVFEGMDASGKGGTIKRLTERIDPRGYVVWPISAPSGEDKERHYLYRFWRRLPEQGQIAIFDRSWYRGIAPKPIGAAHTARSTSSSVNSRISARPSLSSGCTSANRNN